MSVVWTAAEKAAMRRRNKLPREQRATLMVVQKHPKRSEYLVHEPGHETHIVAQSTVNSAMLKCDCTLAGFNKVCSHIIAIQKQQQDAEMQRSK